MESETSGNYSQCPGECYDSFWENVLGDNQPALDIKEITKGKRWDKGKREWVKITEQYRIDYYKDGDLERRWKYSETLHSAIASAHRMIQSGGYTIIGIEVEYPNRGQD